MADLTKHRLRCHLWGCIQAEEYPGCHFCGIATYDPEFIQVGKLDWLMRLRSWARWRTGQVVGKFSRKKCEQCGKKFWRGYDDQLCSEECHEDWLPF